MASHAQSAFHNTTVTPDRHRAQPTHSATPSSTTTTTTTTAAAAAATQSPSQPAASYTQTGGSASARGATPSASPALYAGAPRRMEQCSALTPPTGRVKGGHPAVTPVALPHAQTAVLHAPVATQEWHGGAHQSPAAPAVPGSDPASWHQSEQQQQQHRLRSDSLGARVPATHPQSAKAPSPVPQVTRDSIHASPRPPIPPCSCGSCCRCVIALYQPASLLATLEVLDQLGSGTYGKVYRARRRATGEDVVLKQVAPQ